MSSGCPSISKRSPPSTISSPRGDLVVDLSSATHFDAEGVGSLSRDQFFDRVDLTVQQQPVPRADRNIGQIRQAIGILAANARDDDVESRPEVGQSDQLGDER